MLECALFWPIAMNEPIVKKLFLWYNEDPALGLQKVTARVLWVINQQIYIVKYQKNL